MATVNCPDCGQENSHGATSCEKCGCPLDEIIICPDCSEQNIKGAAICSKCGCPLDATEEKTKLGKKIPSSVIAIALVIAVAVSGIIAVVSNNRNSLKEKLVEGSMWLDAETNARVRFDDDGKMMYSIISLNGGFLGGGNLEYSISTAEYKVKSKNKIKVGGETVKVIFRSDGKIMFEPDLGPIIHEAAKEAEKGE